MGLSYVDMHEIRVRLGGVSRQRVYQIVERSDFPTPVAVLAQGRIWLASEVEDWLAIYRSDQGQPSVATRHAACAVWPCSRSRRREPRPRQP
jgi:predicted DNA-binding transcriptional regulator AlpA